ncbi:MULTISPECIES: helix-turn-helix domain-containing protein [unclassified Streptomyces]|uniref:helix-turn-helix domain-containing protein n=1 Tax=unclassified Streptomyces TaxID=2593676 RepID=UPI002DD9A212|nr:helix-turn-helix domain-containing protein [Streptomyces sp. NBC_01237]WRZ70776.1 helix-turn-helix domain-containing protein [Streptomyces sp. NBC_01237]
MDTVDLLLHPVRMRIVHAMYDGGTRTTTELCALLPDVSKATVYRHVGLLADGGLLTVEGERRVRGSVERQYRLHRSRATIDAATASSMSLEDYRRGFAVAMATLMAEFDAYLDRDGAEPTADLVGFRQHALWLSQDELAEMINDLRGVIVARMNREPSPERSRYLLSPILFPAETRTPRTPDPYA